jgi:hypothetical protein
MGDVVDKSVTFNIFYENNLCKTYTFYLHEKIIDIKNKIRFDLFEEKFNYISLENISPRIYKDFGKLFFDKGIMPDTNNNFKLDQFTIENRTFDFNVYPKNIVIQEKKEEEKRVRTKPMYNEPYVKETKKNIVDKNIFVFKDDDFPSL